MSFDDCWEEVEKLKALPEMAIKQIPTSLSAESKKRLMMKEPEETAEILKNAISQFKRRSIESTESLVKKRLRIE